jgi:hypothetical protein
MGTIFVLDRHDEEDAFSRDYLAARGRLKGMHE